MKASRTPSLNDQPFLKAVGSTLFFILAHFDFDRKVSSEFTIFPTVGWIHSLLSRTTTINH